MEIEGQFDYLIDLAESVGIVIRRVRWSQDGREYPGGALVHLKGKEMLVLDPSAPIADQIDVVASALRGRAEIEDRFLPPEIRDRIEQA